MKEYSGYVAFIIRQSMFGKNIGGLRLSKLRNNLQKVIIYAPRIYNNVYAFKQSGEKSQGGDWHLRAVLF